VAADREHVGELEFVLSGDSAAALFAEAARLLAEEEAPDGLAGAPPEEPVEVDLAAPDLAALLVDWINELVYLTETTDRAYPQAEVLSLTDGTIHARVTPVRATVRHAVKAATLHGVRVGEEGGRWIGRVVVDV
jgi:SHS2 domain-containing protein